jgi:transcriptional regulator with XRE-family HTH domain
MDIGFKIKTLRDKKRLSQPELAHRLGISQTALCEIESGKTKKIDFLLMDKVCKEFEVDFDYFIENKGERYSFKKNENNNIVVGKIEVLNNTMPEGILEKIIYRLEKLEAVVAKLS